MWANESVFYQIYPIGFCGAPLENDGQTVSRILKVKEWSDYLKEVGFNAIYFSPIFESDNHGYDTRDYRKIDCRLGTNEDFAEVCKDLHEKEIKVVLDGVFNHVGRGFWAFQDVLKNRESSKYKDWFYINFGQNNAYNDGLYYEGWEGHYELVKLNLRNREVVEHLFACIKGWVEEFDIDGLRLDVAYMIDREFLRELRAYCNNLKPEFFLIGETIHGDYNQIVNDDMLHSCTNYECYKGVYSSLNSKNMFEIAYSLNRQFGPENWTIYKGKHLVSFVDNHDVTRLASILSDKRHLNAAYALIFAMPGIPCVYYGSEWGVEGRKEDGDASLRPCIEKPEANELTEFIKKLAEIRKDNKALAYGGYKNIVLTNLQLVFERYLEGETVYVGINIDDKDFKANFSWKNDAVDLLTGEEVDLSSGVNLPPFSVAIWK
ncbi:MAG: alpha-amylase family glycosyl hydrolase [Clostridium sp.]|nr:alpha-amylase family glycosyl hydrolase [Clostridium sp.]MDY3829218.1 alpha-amylase family glycosyl hydrolase [Clostridium sp.]